MTDIADIEARHQRECLCGQVRPCDARLLLDEIEWLRAKTEFMRQDAASWRKIAEGAHDECYERAGRAEQDAARLAEALREAVDLLYDARCGLIDLKIKRSWAGSRRAVRTALAAHDKEASGG